MVVVGKGGNYGTRVDLARKATPISRTLPGLGGGGTIPSGIFAKGGGSPNGSYKDGGG